MEFCGLIAIDNEPIAADVSKSTEGLGRERFLQLQNHLQCVKTAVAKPRLGHRDLGFRARGDAPLSYPLCIVVMEVGSRRRSV